MVECSDDDFEFEMSESDGDASSAWMNDDACEADTGDVHMDLMNDDACEADKGDAHVNPASASADASTASDECMEWSDGDHDSEAAEPNEVLADAASIPDISNEIASANLPVEDGADGEKNDPGERVVVSAPAQRSKLEHHYVCARMREGKFTKCSRKAGEVFLDKCARLVHGVRSDRLKTERSVLHKKP